MATTENLLTQHRYSRSNQVAEDPRAQAGLNNAGHGITATLTGNLFNQSFPDGEEELQLFKTFGGAPRVVVGQGIKNVQGGIKETETFVDYKVGDLLQLKIKNRPKVYESIVPSSNQIRIQISLDYPPHGHVDKWIDPADYGTWIDLYRATLNNSMAKTVYEMLRFFFISSAFGACLPKATYDRLLLKTLAQTDLDNLPRADIANRPLENEVPLYSPLMMQMIHHKDHFKALSEEMNRKITNINVYDVEDVMVAHSRGTTFNPYKPGKTGSERGTTELDAQKRLIRCLNPHGQTNSNMEGRMSREKSLKAFAIVLSTIADEMSNPTTGSYWGQGNCGNIYGSQDSAGSSSSVPAVLYRNNKGKTVMNKPMNERPFLEVVCKKENKILVMSGHDLRDYNSGEYEGGFGAESMGKINWSITANKFSEIIPIVGLPDGHAIMMDKRMMVGMPHLDSAGRDTIAQRLAVVDTLHKGIIFGLFDQFCATRIQMVSFTGNPLNMNSILFSEKDVNLLTASGGNDAQRLPDGPST